MSGPPTFKSFVAEEWRYIRTLRYLQIRFDPDKCTGAWECYEVCPVGCWTPHRERRKVEFHDPQCCIACGACVLQCPSDAIELK